MIEQIKGSSIMKNEGPDFIQRLNSYYMDGQVKSDDDLTLILESQNFIPHIQEMIEVHKYFLNQGHAREIPYDLAIDSWLEYVFSPIRQICEKRRKNWKTFSSPTKVAIIISIMTIWDYLKKQYSKNKKPISTTKAFYYYYYLTAPTKLHRIKYLLQFYFAR